MYNIAFQRARCKRHTAQTRVVAQCAVLIKHSCHRILCRLWQPESGCSYVTLMVSKLLVLIPKAPDKPFSAQSTSLLKPSSKRVWLAGQQPQQQPSVRTTRPTNLAAGLKLLEECLCCPYRATQCGPWADVHEGPWCISRAPSYSFEPLVWLTALLW